MKIAFTTEKTDWDAKIDARFGRTAFIAIYDEEKDDLTSIDNSELNKMAHGVGPKLAQRMIEENVNVVITGNGPGDNALRIMEKSKIEMYVDAHDLTLKEAYEQFKNNKLRKLQ